MTPKSKLTKLRIGLAFGVAGFADLLQIVVTSIINTPYLWTAGELSEYALDMVTAGLTILLLGFHPALFPAFISKVIPSTSLLPSWTACVSYVIWSRKDDIATPLPKAEIPKPLEKSEKLPSLPKPAASGLWILVIGAVLIGWFVWVKFLRRFKSAV